MSGPLERSYADNARAGAARIEIKQGRHTRLGGTSILRVLPTKRRRAIGPWCFVDLIRPDDLESPPPLEIGPHPHIGLSTVTWLFAGSVLHSDSLGTEQPIRPGELNLMSAGHGVAHAEESLEIGSGSDTGGVLGAQMWLAQDDVHRNGAPTFAHHTDLPLVELASSRARIIAGTFAGTRSPAAALDSLIGIDIELSGSVELPLDPAWEHGVLPIDQPLKVADEIVEPGSVAVVPQGYHNLRLETRSHKAKALIIGGEPLAKPIVMWWNFVARSKAEITNAWRDWDTDNTDRFGPVPTGLRRIDAPRPPWLPRS